MRRRFNLNGRPERMVIDSNPFGLELLRSSSRFCLFPQTGGKRSHTRRRRSLCAELVSVGNNRELNLTKNIAGPRSKLFKRYRTSWLLLGHL